MKWKYIVSFSSGFKPHACPEVLTEQLSLEIIERGDKGSYIEDVKDIVDLSMDLPGMVSTKRSWEKIDVDGLSFEIPSQDFNMFLHFFENAPLRTFSDGSKYHKVHSWINCIVVTPEQRTAIVEQMKNLMPDAMKKGQKDDQDLEDAKAHVEAKGLLYRGDKKKIADA